MTLRDLKGVAEKFRGVADDKGGIASLSTSTKAANQGDTEVTNLCDRFVSAASAEAVRTIADEVKARTA